MESAAEVVRTTADAVSTLKSGYFKKTALALFPFAGDNWDMSFRSPSMSFAMILVMILQVGAVPQCFCLNAAEAAANKQAASSCCHPKPVNSVSDEAACPSAKLQRIPCGCCKGTSEGMLISAAAGDPAQPQKSRSTAPSYITPAETKALFTDMAEQASVAGPATTVAARIVYCVWRI